MTGGGALGTIAGLKVCAGEIAGDGDALTGTASVTGEVLIPRSSSARSSACFANLLSFSRFSLSSMLRIISTASV